jgi:HSP20 family protein
MTPRRGGGYEEVSIMALIKWNDPFRLGDPFRELATLQDRMNRVFEDTLARGRRDEEVFTGTWAPPVDIVETKDKLTLTAELPGFAEDQIHIDFEDGVLAIAGERRFEKESKEENYHRVERSYGKFLRSFSLPANVDSQKISARFANGLLTIEMPKREETKPKSIKVQVGAPVLEGKKA